MTGPGTDCFVDVQVSLAKQAQISLKNCDGEPGVTGGFLSTFQISAEPS